jgi:hypothetical protein
VGFKPTPLRPQALPGRIRAFPLGNSPYAKLRSVPVRAVGYYPWANRKSTRCMLWVPIMRTQESVYLESCTSKSVARGHECFDGVSLCW